jgi:tRNA pseudouridine55 synthase
VLLFGEGTKLSRYLTLQSKRYRATVRLGFATDTDDAQGTPLGEGAYQPGAVSAGALEAALEAERFRTLQVPPAVSAIKVAGQRAYRLSRAGHPPVLEPRAVSVEELRLLRFDGDQIELELHVSKGYFVRSLARDIGARLGFPAHLCALRRLASGTFGLDRAAAWPPEIAPPLQPVADAARQALPSMTLTAEGELFARQGKRLGLCHFTAAPADAESAGVPSAWFAPGGALVALGERRAEDEFAVLRGFQSETAPAGAT